ncbi:hypothetical protein [Deinococcus radiophilus]|uniref:Uncharacterized protein n=1 Tax=Deinococcus radiophilus TaxID=32062 RepID=A0A3S0K8T7_9DEIO|nr:hypothetical protein [Deinococcus radiophilus]RTR25228.1 hypothetical protein EJ104_11825 [Deinococcus radiophilus]UFA50244.1 hypothetical protein LMT64_10280 [Deinococcus radiophilus]
MNRQTTQSSGGGAGRTALWVVLALALAALAYLTLGLAIPNNPLYSDRSANGISKYQFLEACQEQIPHTPEMESVRSELTAQNMLGEDDSLYTELIPDSEELVDSIRVSNEPETSWEMTVPVRVHSQLTGKPLAQIVSQCRYDREQNAVMVMLRPAPQGL